MDLLVHLMMITGILLMVRMIYNYELNNRKEEEELQELYDYWEEVDMYDDPEYQEWECDIVDAHEEMMERKRQGLLD